MQYACCRSLHTQAICKFTVFVGNGKIEKGNVVYKIKEICSYFILK